MATPQDPTNSSTVAVVTRQQGTSPNKASTVPFDDPSIVTNTTTVDANRNAVFNNQSVPFMREIDISFVTARLRPERKIYNYFDDVEISSFIERPNVIRVTGDFQNQLKGVATGKPDIITIGGVKAKVLLVEPDYTNPSKPATIFNRIYVEHLTNPARIAVGAVIKSSNTEVSFSTRVAGYEHYSGIVQIGSSNTEMILSPDANNTITDYYSGNTITIVKGNNAGQTRQIVSYDATNRSVVIDPPFDREVTGDLYSIGDYRAPWIDTHEQGFFATHTGYHAGVIHIPEPKDYANTGLRFKTGDRVFRVLDNDVNDVTNYATRAEYLFKSNNLDMHQTQLIANPAKDAPTIDKKSVVAADPGRPITSKIPVTPSDGRKGIIAPTPTPTRDVLCKTLPAACNLRVDGGCFVKDASNDITLGTIFEGGFLQIDCIPRWRFVDSQGIVIKGFPNRQFSDASIDTNAVKLNIPGSLNYKAYSPNWTAGYHPLTRTPFNNNDASTLEEVAFINGTYMQFWAPETNGWGPTIDVAGQKPIDVFCKTTLCQPKTTAPTAQSFYISAVDNKSGVFVSSVTLFFKAKGTLPIEVQIRPMTAGYPSSTNIIPDAVAVLNASQVNLTAKPDPTVASSGTTFTFPSPVYLPSGYEYALVVISDDWGYSYFTAEVGQKQIGSTELISKQTYSGSVYKAQNGSAWIPVDAEDMAFMVNKCSFAPLQGTLYLEEDKVKERDVTLSNHPYDAMQYQADAIEINSTQLKFAYKATANSDNSIDGNWQEFLPESTINMAERKVLLSPTNTASMLIKVDMNSNNPDVSPVFYNNRQNLILLTNKINASGISNTQVIITNGGSGYDASNTFVTITGKYKTKANAYATITDGAVTGIIVDYPGTGYFDDVTMTIVGGDNTATALVTSETDASGGPATTRYISEVVTLLDGFDAGDIRAYITAVKPAGSDVQLYYRVRNLTDREPIENRKWTRMSQKTSEYIYSVNNNKIEYEYRPSLTSNSVTYTTKTTTYKTFNQFQVKIVITSMGTVASQVPYVYDVRAIALPADVY